MFSNEALYEHNYRSNDSVCKSVSSQIVRLLHWGPIWGLSIVVFLFFTSLYCIFTSMVFFSSTFRYANAFIMAISFSIIMRSYLLSAWYGPGFVELGWKPKCSEDEKCLQYCSVCKGYKPPRAHHCAKCGRCVLKMDHHCPWINTCVGYINHGLFLHFVMSAPLGCLHCSLICVWHLYFMFNQFFYMFSRGKDYRLYFHLYEVLGIFSALGLALGVSLAVGGLAIFQLRSIFRNETAIESWILAKAKDRRRSADEPPFTHPYHLGCKMNSIQVLNWTGSPVGDGYNFPIRPGCSAYDLTIEQLKQKAAKANSACEFTIKRAYSGTFFPIFSFGIRVSCCFPCNAEVRMRVQPGDRILVTRCYKRWFYGQKLPGSTAANCPVSKDKQRGWFPRQCADEFDTPNKEKEN